MKIFRNCTVVLEFDLNTPFKQKVEWRKKITENGGVVSFVMTKRVSFLVVFNRKTTSSAYKLRQSIRYDIPVVQPKYIDMCIQKERLLKTNTFIIPVGSNESFKKGKIQDTKDRNRGIRQRRFKVVVNLEKQPSWIWGMSSAPVFNEDNFELPKWALLIKKEGTQVQVIEVHVQSASQFDDNAPPIYRLYTQSGIVTLKTVSQAEDAVVWYFETAAEVISGNEQLYRRYTATPMTMKPCQPGEVNLGELGSKKLRLTVGQLSLLHEKVSNQVAALVDGIWNEALHEIDAHLEVPMNYANMKAVEEAHIVLRQLGTILSSGGDGEGQEVRTLIDQFYEALPHKPEHRKDIWSLQDVVAMQDFCQLLSDIVTVSEATDWSSDAAIIAKYRALACHIQHLNQSTEEFSKVSRLVQDSMEKGGIVHSVYKVWKTVESVSFDNDIGRNRLLMHASPAHNYLGILSRGLLLPNSVQDERGVIRTDSGHLGCGIYFSDSAMKSLQYTTPFSQSGTQLLLLCDVALGHEHSVSKPDFTLIAPPEGYDSVHGVAATPDQTSFFKDNEYAIYSTHQQCLRYVVEVSLPSDKIAMNKVISSNRTLQEDVGPVLQSLQATEVDTSDVRDIIDPLAKVKAGLQGSSKEPVPLKSVHVRARMLDLVAQVVVLQAYRNDSSCSIEAKYVFPLDETAAVCGFEAFINGKHIIGQCKEKAKARREYKEAVSKGHGAYLMEEESADVFTVSIGNLPPQSDVLIKITYIMELAVDGDAVCLNVPASVAPWIKDRAAAQKTQSMTKTVNAGFNKQGTVTLQVSIEMATEIRRVLSPTHNIKLKKTATKAVVTLPKKSSLESGFQLQVYLVAIHMPRMWVERHPEYNTQACMLTFYPEFETVPESEPELLIILDMSNSMKGSAETDAKKVALLTLDNLPKTCVFNIMVFGSSFRELFSAPQKCSEFSREIARQFIQGISASLGSTDLFEPIHAVQCLGSPTSPLKNLFLISDGHVTQESLVTMVTKSTASKLRMFTLGVGDTPNHHFLKNLASVGGGDYQCFYNKTKSQWERKMKSLLEKISQPGLSEVKIDWLQTDDIAQPPVQTPNQIPSLFSGCRQVVYGFVEGCMQATLKAKVQGQEMETTVSTTDLQVTTGKMLHQLVARSVISDYENGVFNPDRIKHEVIKLQKKASIIEMSKKFSIVTPYTSFVAVEDRSQDELVNVDGPAIEDLVAKETVDLLPYIDWESHQEIEDKDVVHTVKELLQKGEVQETFSMVRAEEIYCQLANYVSEIQENPMLAKQVYDSLGRYYKHNQSASVGNILSDLEPFLQGNDNRMMLSSDKDGDISRSKQLNISADTKHYLSALVPEFAIYDPKSRAMKVHCQTGKKRKKRKRSRWDPKETSNEIVEVMIVDETHSENEAHRNVGGIKHGVDNIVLNEMEDMFVGNFANTELLLENTVNLSENIERTKQAHSLIAQTSHMNDKPAPCEKKSGPVYRKSIALARKKQIATKSVPAAESIMTDSEEDDIDLDYNDDMIDMETDDLSEIAGLFTADTSDIPSNVYGDITDVYNQLDTSEAEGWEELTPKVLMADSKSKQVTNKEDDSHCQILYEQLCSENTAMNQTALSAALLSAPQEIQEEGRISNNELADDTEKEFSPMLNNGLSMAPDISASEYYANFESTQQTYIPTAYMSNFQITPSMVQSSSQLTPAYSPMAPAYSSMAPVFSSTTQTYSNKSPAFSPMSPAYSTMTAARRSHGHKETSISQPLIGHGSLYKKCGSPSYSPTSPCYSPVSPGFIADTTPVSVSRCERPTDSDEDQYRGRENRQIGKLNSLLGNTRSRSKRSSSTESKTEIIICRNPRRRSRSNSLSSRCRFGSRERRHSKQRSKSRSRERRHRKQRSRSRSRERRHRKQRSRSRSRERRHRMHNEKRIGKILSGKTHLERDRSDRSTAEKVSNDQIENAQLEKKIANSSLKAVSHRKIMQVEDILGGYEQFRERMKAIGRDSERETMGSSPTKLVRCTKTGRWERKPALSEDDHEKHEQAVEDDIDTVATFTPSFCPRFIDKSFVWKGVRKNRHRVDVLDFNHIEQLTDEEQVEAAGSELLKFWDLTPELCQAIGVSMETIDDILVVQGVRSLGQMVHKEVDKVVATLLSIVVFTLKQYIKKHRKVFNLDNNLDINILTINSKASTIAVNGIEIEYKEPYSSGLLWLKSKERELPPLYNILELGNSKMDFLCQLVKIFVQ